MLNTTPAEVVTVMLGSWMALATWSLEVSTTWPDSVYTVWASLLRLYVTLYLHSNTGEATSRLSRLLLLLLLVVVCVRCLWAQSSQ
jgi:hypothetical protein